MRRSALALLAGLSLCLAGWPPGVRGVPASEGDAEIRLQEIRERIDALSARLNEARTARERLHSRLRDIEVEIGEVSARLREIDHELHAKGENLRGLRRQQQALKQALAAQREALARHVRAAYVLGQQDTLKLLFQQEDPARVSRALMYHAYFSRDRARRIQAVRARLARIDRIGAAIRRETQSLQALREEERSARAELERQRAERERVLASLAREIRDTGARLQRLREDERKLEELLEGLREELADIPKTLDERAAFAALRGRLAWPSLGRIVHRFGSPRGSGDTRWQGVLIAAEEGQAVQAISHGRVAYADWFRGFGLLLIIDHGDGYMSLYGHNQALFKEVGDWVEPGEVIARVGTSGGLAESGLYFEIRHQGQPQDPSKWCRQAVSGSARAGAGRRLSPTRGR